ncbi:MAG: hypothetical protein ABW022_11415 [Actinoplanes sp.]
MSGVVLDASALVIYAKDDLQALPVDELLRELRDDPRSPLAIPALAHEDALRILDGDSTATARLWALSDEHGVVPASPDMLRAVNLIVGEGRVSAGMAHAMLLAAQRDWLLATYAAPTLQVAGFEPRLILDLDEVFRAE